MKNKSLVVCVLAFALQAQAQVRGIGSSEGQSKAPFKKSVKSKANAKSESDEKAVAEMLLILATQKKIKKDEDEAIRRLRVACGREKAPKGVSQEEIRNQVMEALVENHQLKSGEALAFFEKACGRGEEAMRPKVSPTYEPSSDESTSHRGD